MNTPNKELSADAQRIFDLAAEHCFKNHIVSFTAMKGCENLRFGENYPNDFTLTHKEQLKSIFQELKSAGSISNFVFNSISNDDGSVTYNITYYC